MDVSEEMDTVENEIIGKSGDSVSGEKRKNEKIDDSESMPNKVARMDCSPLKNKNEVNNGVSISKKTSRPFFAPWKPPTSQK